MRACRDARKRYSLCGQDRGIRVKIFETMTSWYGHVRKGDQPSGTSIPAHTIPVSELQRPSVARCNIEAFKGQA